MTTPSEVAKFSIIGTAGRSKDPNEQMSADLYYKMIATAIEAINICSAKSVILVSGGAAWSDHVAVDLFLNRTRYPLKVPIIGLELHLPGNLDLNTGRYVDTGSNDWRSNPGRTSNYYHEKFSSSLGDTNRAFHELVLAVKNGAKIAAYNGFHDRNIPVAYSNFMLAFTWGRQEPEDGGTLHTWNQAAKSNCKRLHVSLYDLKAA